MKIMAFVIGFYGDVKPFIVLGREMKKRTHCYSIATLETFREEIENNGLEYRKLSGDAKELAQRLLSENNGESGNEMEAIRYLLKKYTGLFDDFAVACQGSDVIIYMQFSAIAYHFAEKYQIPCVRTFVFPFDATAKYSPMVPEAPENTWKCKISHTICSFGMSYASRAHMNTYRKKLGLKKWGYFSSYKKMNRQPILTLYQYSEALAEREPAWGNHIHITGPWKEEESTVYKADEELVRFRELGERHLYICFGSMASHKLKEFKNLILKVLEETGQRAVLVFPRELRGESNQQLHYVSFIPYRWLPKVSAVIHHGGSGTTHQCLQAGKLMLVFAFGADQMFWGRRAAKLGAAPAPFDLRQDIITKEAVKEKILALMQSGMTVQAQKIAGQIARDRGAQAARDIIEQRFSGVVI